MMLRMTQSFFWQERKLLHLRTIIMAQILMRMQQVMTLLLSCLHRNQQLSVQVRFNYVLLFFVQIEITKEVSYLKENKRGKGNLTRLCQATVLGRS